MSNNEDLEWLTEMDKEILGILSTELTLTPSVIAENIDRSQKGVGNRLSALQAGELVEKVDRGKYRATDEGISAIFDEADRSDAKIIGSRKVDIQHRRQVRGNFGVSMEEYRKAIQEELKKLSNEELDNQDTVEEAIERAEKQITKDSSQNRDK